MSFALFFFRKLEEGWWVVVVVMLAASADVTRTFFLQMRKWSHGGDDELGG